LSEEDLPAFLAGTPVSRQVGELTRMVFDCGLMGVVCSPWEVETVRAQNPAAFLVVPGIRSAADAADDQKRTLTAAEALAKGADLLVIGRPILKASDRAGAVENLLKEIK
jgi:orotidine-5'-phosphate decarboxylase